MPDISKCHGEGCSVKDNCYRFTAESSPIWQSYFSSAPIENNKCENFWSNGSTTFKTEKKSLTILSKIFKSGKIVHILQPKDGLRVFSVSESDSDRVYVKDTEAISEESFNREIDIIKTKLEWIKKVLENFVLWCVKDMKANFLSENEIELIGGSHTYPPVVTLNELIGLYEDVQNN